MDDNFVWMMVQYSESDTPEEVVDSTRLYPESRKDEAVAEFEELVEYVGGESGDIEYDNRHVGSMRYDGNGVLIELFQKSFGRGDM